MSAPIPPASSPTAAPAAPAPTWGPALMRMRSSLAAFAITALLVLVMRWDPLALIATLGPLLAEIVMAAIMHRTLKPSPFWLTLAISLMLYLPLTILFVHKLRSCPLPAHVHGH